MRKHIPQIARYSAKVCRGVIIAPLPRKRHKKPLRASVRVERAGVAQCVRDRERPRNTPIKDHATDDGRMTGEARKVKEGQTFGIRWWWSFT